jgi:hypothetical protein
MESIAVLPPVAGVSPQVVWTWMSISRECCDRNVCRRQAAAQMSEMEGQQAAAGDDDPARMSSPRDRLFAEVPLTN